MTTTDTDVLVEKALWGLTRVYDAPHGGTETGVHAPVHEVVTAVLPIVAEEKRKAKAEAFDEGWKDRARRDVYRAYAFIDEKRNVPGPPASLNPYREAGDSDEHR